MSDFTRRNFVIGSSITALTTALIGKSPAQDAAPIIWGPPAGPSIIPAFAVATGLFNALLPNCQFKVWNSPDQIRAGLSSQTITMAIMPSYSGANLYNKGLNLRLANILTTGLLYIVAPQSANITKLDDLIGKRLAVPFKNDMPDYVLQTILKANHIEQSQIKIQYTASPPEALPLLMTDKVDAALLMEPASSAAISISAITGKNIERVINIQDLWKQATNGASIPQAGLLVGKGFAGEEGSQKINEINKIFETALAKIQEDPKNAATRVAGVLNFPAHIIEASLNYSNLVVQDAKTSRPSLEKFFKILMEQNPAILGGKLPDDGFYN